MLTAKKKCHQDFIVDNYQRLRKGYEAFNWHTGDIYSRNVFSNRYPQCQLQTQPKAVNFFCEHLCGEGIQRLMGQKCDKPLMLHRWWCRAGDLNSLLKKDTWRHSLPDALATTFHWRRRGGQAHFLRLYITERKSLQWMHCKCYSLLQKLKYFKLQHLLHSDNIQLLLYLCACAHTHTRTHTHTQEIMLGGVTIIGMKNEVEFKFRLLRTMPSA